MEQLVQNVSTFAAGRVTTQQDTVQFTALLMQTLRNLPPLPLHEELTPCQSYFEHAHNASLLQTLSESVMKNFDHNCQVRFCASVAARIIQPTQIDQISTPDICRRVVWAFDQGKLSALDVVSYAYMLVLASLHSKQKTFFFDYEQGSDESQEDVVGTGVPVEEYFNSISNTLLVFKTEVGLRRSSFPYNFVFHLIAVAELIIVIKQMAPNATEELTYEVVCAKVGQLFLGLFRDTSQYLSRESPLSVKQLWLYRPGSSSSSVSFTLDAQDEAQQISLLTTTAGCLPLLQVQSYIERVNRTYLQQKSKEEALQKETQRAHETLRQFQEQKGAYLIQNTVISETNKTYKRFQDLSEKERQAIKFKATGSLNDYIRLKKQLGIPNEDTLFEDDMLLQQRDLKHRQMENTVNTRKLKAIETQAESLVLTSKVEDVAVLPGFKSFVKSLEPIRMERGNYLQTQERRIPANMAMPLAQYRLEVQKTFYHQLHQQLASWQNLKLILLLITQIRAIYGNKLFRIRKFADIMNFYDQGLRQAAEDAEQMQQQAPELKFSVKMEDVVLVDADNKTRKTKITRIEPQAAEPDARRQHATDSQQKQSQALHAKLRNIQYTHSKMRLVIDNSIIGTTHDILLGFIKWLSLTAKLKEDQTKERKLVQLRNFCLQITDQITASGPDFGFIPYVEDFNIVQHLIENETLLKTYSADEAASVMLSFWVLPYNLDSFPLIESLVGTAVSCNPILLDLLKQMLGDLYVYLDCGSAGLRLASQLFDASDQ